MFSPAPRLHTEPISMVDVIGDVHGCADELEALLTELGYSKEATNVYVHPEGRLAAFSGDLVLRGPDSVRCMEIVLAMQKAGSGYLAALGNHDWKLYCAVMFGGVIPAEPEAQGLRELSESNSPRLVSLVGHLFENVPSHSVFDHGRLVVTHAAIDPAAQRQLAEETIVHGEQADHDTPQVAENSVNLNSGVEFGGRLSAYRHPENELVSVGATRRHCQFGLPERFINIAVEPLAVERRVLQPRPAQPIEGDDRRTPPSADAPRAITRP